MYVSHWDLENVCVSHWNLENVCVSHWDLENVYGWQMYRVGQNQISFIFYIRCTTHVVPHTYSSNTVCHTPLISITVPQPYSSSTVCHTPLFKQHCVPHTPNQHYCATPLFQHPRCATPLFKHYCVPHTLIQALLCSALHVNASIISVRVLDR